MHIEFQKSRSKLEIEGGAPVFWSDVRLALDSIGALFLPSKPRTGEIELWKDYNSFVEPLVEQSRLSSGLDRFFLEAELDRRNRLHCAAQLLSSNPSAQLHVTREDVVNLAANLHFSGEHTVFANLNASTDAQILKLLGHEAGDSCTVIGHL